MPREKAVPETDATSCRRNGRVFALSLCDPCGGSFQKYGKICRAEGKPERYKRVGGGGLPRTCYANAGQSRMQGQIGAQRGVPPSFLLPLPFILSITPSAPAANLKQQVPTPLLHGSRSPSGFLLPLPMYGHAARSGRGFRF